MQNDIIINDKECQDFRVLELKDYEHLIEIYTDERIAEFLSDEEAVGRILDAKIAQGKSGKNDLADNSEDPVLLTLDEKTSFTESRAQAARHEFVPDEQAVQFWTKQNS